LICHRGQVLSQNVDWLDSFNQVEPLGWDASRAFESDSHDPRALVRQ